MKDEPYPNWVGPILGFLLHGSAHFLSGDKAAGITWYGGIALTNLTAILVLTLPGLASFVMSVVLLCSALVCWLIMMKHSVGTTSSRMEGI